MYFPALIPTFKQPWAELQHNRSQNNVPFEWLIHFFLFDSIWTVCGLSYHSAVTYVSPEIQLLLSGKNSCQKSCVIFTKKNSKFLKMKRTTDGSNQAPLVMRLRLTIYSLHQSLKSSTVGLLASAAFSVHSWVKL